MVVVERDVFLCWWVVMEKDGVLVVKWRDVVDGFCGSEMCW